MILQSGAREENSETDRDSDSAPPIHWVELVGHKSVEKKTPPDQTKDGVVQRRCHSVQMHTNEDSSPSQPPLLVTHKQTGAHFVLGRSTKAEQSPSSTDGSVHVNVKQISLGLYSQLLCVIRWGRPRVGVSVSSEHHASALPDHDPPLRPLHTHGPQKDSLQRLHFR